MIEKLIQVIYFRLFATRLQRKVAIRSCLVLLCALIWLPTATTQTASEKNKEKYIVAPTENTLLVVASQPDSPLRIENARLLLNTEKSWDFRFLYGLHNQSEKPIRTFSLIFWTSESTGGTITDNRLKEQILLPGQTIAANFDFKNNTIIPLTDALQAKLKLGAPMKTITFLIVQNVEFADGTRFSDEKTIDALKKYFEDFSN